MDLFLRSWFTVSGEQALLSAMLADKIQIFSNIFLSRPLKEGTIKMQRKSYVWEFNTEQYSSKIRLKEKSSCKAKDCNGASFLIQGW